MRIANPYHLGPLVSRRRRDLGMTQADVCAAAQVSRRWLSGLEGGKVTAEVGLVFRVLAVLKLTVDIAPEQPVPGLVDLDEVLREHTRQPEATHD